MNKKRSKEEEDELAEIIKQYESRKKEHRGLYLDADQYADIVYYYLGEGLSGEAMEVVEFGLRIHPENIVLLMAKTITLLEDDKLKEARSVLDSIIDEEEPELPLIEIEILAKEGRIEEAEEIITGLSTDENDSWMMAQIAEVCIEADFPEYAEGWIMKALELEPEDEDIMSIAADCQYHLGEFEEAVALYNKLLDLQPYSSLYWTNLSKAYLSLSMFNKSIDAADFAIVAEEDNAEARSVKGNALFGIENYQAAIDEFQKAREMGGIPEDFACLLIGVCYSNMENWEMAYDYYLRAMAGYNEDTLAISSIWLNLARCKYEIGAIEEALDYCETLHRKFPKSGEIYLLHGKICLDTGNTEEAAKLWEKAIDIAPIDDTWNYIGENYMYKEMYDDAEKAFLTLKELNPDYPNLRGNLGLVYLGKHDDEKFKEYKEDLRETFGNHPDILNYKKDNPTT